MRATRCVVVLLSVLSSAGAARAERELGALVARYAFVGPTQNVELALRADGHMSRVRRPTHFMELGEEEAPSTEERRVEPRVIDALRRAALRGLCGARSTPGSSVGGAWDLEVILAAGKRCHVHRRARLSIEPPLARLRDALLAAWEKATPIEGQPGAPPR
jgi:hypothetical protein